MNSIATVCRSGVRALSALLFRCCRKLRAHPGWSLLAFTALTLLFTYNLTQIRFLFSAQDMVGEGIPSADELPGLRERYEDGTSSTLLLTPPDGQFSFSPEELCQIRKWYSITRSTHRELKSTFSTFDVKRPLFVGPSRVNYRNLLSLNCETRPPTVDLETSKRLLEHAPWASLKDRTGRLSLIFSFTYKDSENSRFGTFDPRVVTPLRQEAEQYLEPRIPGAKMHWVGLGDYQWYVRKGFQFSGIVNSIMILVMILSLRYLYGTWLSGILFCSTLIFNGIWIYGGKALFGSPYDVLASGLFLILGVSSIEDFTFLSSEQLRGANWKKSIRRLMIPAFFTSLTTFIGFISLCASELAVIRRFGLWCALGSMLEWLMLFGIMPLVLERFSTLKSWVDPKRAGALRFDRFSTTSVPRWISRACLLVFPLALFCFPRFEVNDDPSAVFPTGHAYNEGLHELKRSKGWQGSVSLISDGATPSELDQAAAELVRRGTVAAFESSTKILDWLSEPQSLSRDEMSEDFKRSLVYKQLVDPSNVPRDTLFLERTTVQDIQALKRETESVCPHHRCHAGGDLVAYSDFSTLVPKTFIDSMGLSLILVTLVLAVLSFAFGLQRHLLHLTIASFWGTCLMISGLVLLKIPMNFMNSIIASVLVGLTGDNAVQYLFAARGGDLHAGIQRRGGASILTNTLMALTSLCYLMSYFNPPKVFGMILAGGLIATLIGDLWLLNGLLGRRTGSPSRQNDLGSRSETGHSASPLQAPSG